MAINLLPAKQKRLARSVYRVHRLIALLLVFDLLLLAILVLLAALNITINQEKTANAKTLATFSGKDQVQEFNALKDEVSLVAKYADVAKEHVDTRSTVTDYFGQIMATRTAGVRLNNLDYATNQDNQTIKLGGIADNRQSLLDFNNRLEVLSWVDTVDSPVANLVGDNNFVFSLTLTLVKPKP